MDYKLSHDAKLDLARIYWRGFQEFGESQADRYYKQLTNRFLDIANTPLKYQAVDSIRNG